VLGREFPLGLVQRVTLKPDDELERRLSGLQAAEFIYEQLAAGDVEYTFNRPTTRCWSSAASSCTSAPDWRWSRYTPSSWTIIWAHHYSRSDNVAKAVEYLRRAGEHSVRGLLWLLRTGTGVEVATLSQSALCPYRKLRKRCRV
jgi:hypothetical protein